ncbi:MAG TPA: glycosyltransferase family 4 protein [Gammaproteobacteria bacterium]|nr:glycosyltransferase family 4 protein [Gammaproteobacteria bacterium]
MRTEALIITRNFPPLTGGMERLTFHTYQALREQYLCTLVGPAGCGTFVAPDSPVAECRLKPLPRFLGEAWIKSNKMARKHRPKLIFAASGLMAPIAVSTAKRVGGAAITVVHGLDLVVPHPLYRRFFLPAIRQSDLVIANSANTAWLAQSKGIKSDKIEILHPGVTLPSRPLMPKKANKKEQKYLLTVGRLVPRKGLVEFVERAMPQLAKRDPSVVLLIAGGEATDALKRDGSVRADIQKAIQKYDLHDHVRLLGRISDDAKLDALYRESDVFVLPLSAQPDDVEGFGMVALEAAAHGVPTAGFRLDGLPDAVESGRSGMLVPPGDYPALIDSIIKLLNDPGAMGISTTSCLAHAERFSWDRYGDRLHALCRRFGPVHPLRPHRESDAL